jgi:metal-sulfur cluster biosynthetic enzyme
MTEADAWDALRRIEDPELGINIVDLGLVRGVEIDRAHIRVRMTLTSAACPMGPALVDDVRRALPGQADIELEWQPPWSPDMMSATAKEQLGW